MSNTVDQSDAWQDGDDVAGSLGEQLGGEPVDQDAALNEGGVDDAESFPVGGVEDGAEEPKKKGSRAKTLAVLVIGGVVLTSVVGVGVMRALSPPKVDVVEDVDVGGASVDASAEVLGAEAVDPVASDVGLGADAPVQSQQVSHADAGASAALAGNPLMRPQVGASAQVASGAVVAAVDSALGQRVATLEGDVREVREHLGVLDQKVGRAASRAVSVGRDVGERVKRSVSRSSVRPRIKSAGGVGASYDGGVGLSQRVVEPAQAGDGGVARVVVEPPARYVAPVEEVVEKPAPVNPLAGLKLRAVYPPDGENQQAWVVDGGALHAVVKGDRIRGHVVQSISRDGVRTSAGVISPE